VDVNVTGILTAQQDVKCDGSMTVRRDILLTNGDVAEDFDVAEIGLQPGTVLCVTDEESLHPCDREYDTRVVGVIAGEGALRPAIVLGRSQASATRAPVALTGRVNCRVDASVNPIVTGDLLTTSARVGYAMRADPHRGPGAIIGKALRSLSNGCGVIPILVALQ